jgi:putative spermidine/putrescine transport system ATP-binding protein
MTDAPLLSVRHLSVRYDGFRAVDDVSFDVACGPFGLGLVGESGSGKTTIARAVVRLVGAERGEISYEGTDVLRLGGTALRRYRQSAQIVFQDPDGTLDPRMRIGAALAEAVNAHRKLPRDEVAQRVDSLLHEVGLESQHRRRFPHQLSGGQRQRVALARSIVNRPKVLLLDEPLGALDLKLRQEMQVFLKSLQRELGMTFIYVTHDQEEALTMSDHLAVFNNGRIEQVGSPNHVYERPATEFVAGFVGTSNIVERGGRRVSVRPERIELNGAGEPATVADVVFVGAFRRILVDTDTGDRLTVVRPNVGSAVEPGTRVHVHWRDEDAYEIQPQPPKEQEVR